MREWIPIVLTGCAIPVLMAGCSMRSPEALYQAEKGEVIRLEHFFVAPEEKEEFELFVVDVLKPAFEDVQPEGNARVRFWVDTEMADDSTFHYAFVIDPYDERYNYDVEAVLKAAYGEQQGDAYRQQFEDFLARSSTIEFQQTEW